MKVWTLAVAVLLMLTGCGNSDLSNRVPSARLQLPACVTAGTLVTLDASKSSDPDGRIERYVFAIDSKTPKLVHNESSITYRFTEPKIVDGRIEQFVVQLQVVDNDGFEAFAQAAMFVVYDLDQCPEEPVFVPDVQVEDVIAEDLPEPQDVPLLDVMPDVAPKDTAPFPDVPKTCPSIAGKYRVEVTCQSQPYLETELTLFQNGCEFWDDFDIVYGTIDKGGFVVLESDMDDLNLNYCEGIVEDFEFFSLECTSECIVTFLANPM